MRKLCLVLSLASALVALGAGLDGARAQAPKEWKIGALFAFSGPLAFLGQETFRGAEIASQIINEAGGNQWRANRLGEGRCRQPRAGPQ